MQEFHWTCDFIGISNFSKDCYRFTSQWIIGTDVQQYLLILIGSRLVITYNDLRLY